MFHPRLAAGDSRGIQPQTHCSFAGGVFQQCPERGSSGWRRRPWFLWRAQADLRLLTMILLETSGQARPIALLGYPRGP